MLDGHVTGPGINTSPADRLDARSVERIRAGVAHPLIAAGIAVVLLTSLWIPFLVSVPAEALCAGEDALRLTWFPPRKRLSPSTMTLKGCRPLTAVYAVPVAARPLLRAARHFTPPGGGRCLQLLSSTYFTPELIGAAAANCQITLPQRGQEHPQYRQFGLGATWQSRVTFTPSWFMGGPFDVQFADDQAFTLTPNPITTMEDVEGRPLQPSPARAGALTSALTPR